MQTGGLGFISTQWSIVGTGDFNGDGNGDNKGPLSGNMLSSDYSGRYNTKLGKCLMLIEATRSFGKEISNSKLLTDAFERRVYAYYLWTSKEGKKYWGVGPEDCELALSLRQTKHCASEEEFKAFVADYMEE